LGLALAEAGVVRPFEVWKRRDEVQDFEHLRKVIEDYEIQAVVVGVPTQLDGRSTPATDRARDFAAKLRGHCEVPLWEWDEALSSFEADQRMEDAGIPPRERKQRRDAFAAMVILEDFLS